jgi:hypothetical protein
VTRMSALINNHTMDAQMLRVWWIISLLHRDTGLFEPWSGACMHRLSIVRINFFHDNTYFVDGYSTTLSVSRLYSSRWWHERWTWRVMAWFRLFFLLFASYCVSIHNFSRLRNNLFITLIPLYVSTLLGHPQVFTVVFNYISFLLLNYNANFHILTYIHSM